MGMEVQGKKRRGRLKRRWSDKQTSGRKECRGGSVRPSGIEANVIIHRVSFF